MTYKEENLVANDCRTKEGQTRSLYSPLGVDDQFMVSPKKHLPFKDTTVVSTFRRGPTWETLRTLHTKETT